MLCGRLHAEGVFACISHAYHAGNNWSLSTALGGVKVQVIREESELARSIERRCLNGEFKFQIEQQFGSPDKIKCPSCGHDGVWKRRPFLLATLSVIVSLLTGVVWPPLYWICVCDECGTEIRQRYGLIGKANASSLPEATYEEIKLTDIPDLLVIGNRSPSKGEEYEALLKSDGKGWISKIGGSVQAFVLVDPSSNSIATLFVATDYWRQGIGYALHNFAVEWLFKRGAKLIGTKAASKRADKFLSALGWKLIDQEADGSYLYELDWKRWQAAINKPRNFMGFLRT